MGLNDIVIIGFGGHARSVADSVLRAGKYNIAGYTDIIDRKCSIKYLGTDDALFDLYNGGIRQAVIGIGFVEDKQVKLRNNVIEKAKKIGFEFPTVIDPSAIVSNSASIGDGCFVGKNTVINSGVNIEEFCIINTGVIVEHDDYIGGGTHIAIGTLLSGEVSVGHQTLIGAGSTVIQCKKIGDNCIVGAGSIVLCDVKDNMKVYGVVK